MPTAMSRPTGLHVLALAVAAITLALPATAQHNPCGPIENAYGPYDYRFDRDKLPIVDGAHFTPTVEGLIRGNRGALGADLDYTLRAFPNHHRALIAVMRWGQRTQSPQPRSLPRPVECYFERAIRFQPRDPLPRMIYAQFLGANNRAPEALRQLESAAEVAGDNGLTHQNIGLVYLDLKEPQRALEQAHKASALGFEPTALREQLERGGHWRNPPTAPVAASAPAS